MFMLWDAPTRSYGGSLFLPPVVTFLKTCITHFSIESLLYRWLEVHELFRSATIAGTVESPMEVWMSIERLKLQSPTLLTRLASLEDMAMAEWPSMSQDTSHSASQRSHGSIPWVADDPEDAETSDAETDEYD